MASIREQLYEREKNWLSPRACFSENTKGRKKPASEDDLRTEFQRDRDKIIHSKSFRRLMHKTQVFLSPDGDHYRTRLTHTLEVSQIGRTIARALRLNEDLVEAIALGHDLGHTPFGHAGERQLARMLDGGFKHSEQSLRVVDVLEDMNLTFEVRNGILCHSDMTACTLEGQIAKFADKIAYLNHDYDDAVMAEVIVPGDAVWDLPLPVKNVLGYDRSERITTMVNSIIRHGTEDRIAFEPEVEEARNAFSDFMFRQVYTNPLAKSEECIAESMLEQLFRYFCAQPEKIPAGYKVRLKEDGVERCVADYISGMTDRYAIAMFKDLFIPKVWQGVTNRES